MRCDESDKRWTVTSHPSRIELSSFPSSRDNSFISFASFVHRLALPRLRLTRFPRAGTRDLARDRHPAVSESTIPYVRDAVVSSEFEFDRGPIIIVSSPVSVAFQYTFFHSVGEDESIKSVVKIGEGEATFSWSSFVKRCSTCNYFVTRPRLCRAAQALAGFAAR